MTTTDVVPFIYDEHQVRTVTVDGAPWFVAVDVCAVLGLGHVSNAVSRLDDDQRASSPITTSNGRTVTVNIVSEPGLYDLVIRSDKPEARPFRRWITTEVVPAILRTGQYTVPAAEVVVPEPRLPQSYAEALRELASTVEALDEARGEVAALTPSAAAWSAMTDASGDYSVREAAQLLDRDPSIDTGQNRLFGYMYDIGWIDRTSRPFQAQLHAGRLATRTQTYPHPHTGETMIGKPQVRVTHKGLTELHKRLGGTRSLAVGKLALVDGAGSS